VRNGFRASGRGSRAEGRHIAEILVFQGDLGDVERAVVAAYPGSVAAARG
jgi:hypothetical protein